MSEVLYPEENEIYMDMMCGPIHDASTDVQEAFGKVYEKICDFCEYNADENFDAGKKYGIGIGFAIGAVTALAATLVVYKLTHKKEETK